MKKKRFKDLKRFSQMVVDTWVEGVHLSSVGN